jgi:RHS repeat-associated protein
MAGRRGQGDALRVVALVAGLCAVAVVLVGLLGGGSAGARGTGRDSVAARVSASSGATERVLRPRLSRSAALRASRRRRWLESAVARAQRIASRTAFRDLSVGASRQLVVRDYRSLLSGASVNPAATIAKSGKVLRYLSDKRALVRTARGLELKESTVPLYVAGGSGKHRPVNLSLVASAGSFAPSVPLTQVSIAGELAGGVAIGSSGLRMTMEGANASGRQIDGQSVFFGGVGPDLDAAVAPTLSGAEMFAVLRSPASPEQLRYQLELPAGATLRAVNGGAVVSSADGNILAWVAPPDARDAQGTNVPVQLAVVGSELVLTVSDRGRELAYPILVDPQVTITESESGWTFTQTGAENLSGSVGLGGLSISSPEFNYPYYPKYPSHEGEIDGSEGKLKWLSHKTPEVIEVEFLGVHLVATSENTKSEPATGVGWEVIACTHGSGNTLNYPPPEKLAFPGENGGAYDCSHPISARIYVDGSSKEPLKDIGTLSISAIVLTMRVPKIEEEAEFGLQNGGRPDEERCHDGWPVNCNTGNEVAAQPDLAVGGRGPGLSFTRTYNSQLAAKQTEHGVLGYGWTGSYSAHVSFEKSCGECAEVATVHQDDAATVNFYELSEKWFPNASGVEATFAKEGSSYIYTLPDQTKLKFNSSGLLTTETDRNGNAVTLTRNSENLIESISDAAGRKLSFTYNGEKEITSISDPMGHTVKYGYESGNLATVTEPGESSARWQYKYNAGHEMTKMTDGRGNIWTTEYEEHRVIRQIDPLGRERKWKYEGTESSGETRITEPNGAVTLDYFNSLGQPTEVIDALGTSAETTTKYAYNEYHLESTTNPDKHTTKYHYDAAGDLVSETNPLGNKTEWEYDSTHDVIGITLPDGEKTTIKRTAAGDAESVSRPAPHETTQTTKYAYDSHGDLESVTNPLGYATKYEYDSYGDRTAEIDPEGNKRTWGYNEASQETSTVSPRGNVGGGEPALFTTTIARDAQGRVTSVTEPEFTGKSSPVNKVQSSIAGTAQEEQTLTAEPGAWEGTPAPTYSYQWQVCNPLGESCYTVPGATGSTTPLNSETLGYTLRVIVTATNSAGSASSTSAATAVVSSGAPPVYASSFGSAGTSNGQFERPTSLAIDASGDVWVADSYNNRIEKFSSSGTWLATYGKYGSGNGEYSEPDGIAINHSTGNVYITDQNNNRVEELNEKGEFVRAFGSAGTGNGQFDEPAGIAIDTKGDVWVTDYSNDRVQEFNEKGEYLSKFGSSGTEHGHFNGPSGVVYSSGVLYVTDLNNDRFQVLTEAGEYLGLVGGSGVEAGRFSLPAGVSASASGDVYIADLGNDRIQEFGEYGNFLAMFGAAGSGAGQLSEPEGIDAGASGEIYVADSGNNRVEKWLPAGKPANTTPPSISGDISIGQTLTAGPGVWAAAPVPTYSYQWQRCNTAGAECANISGATSATHTLVTADLGDTLRVVVVATNSGGNATASSAATETVLGSRTTEYAYDANGNLESVTDPARHKTKYTYDADNEQTKIESPNGTVTETEYDSEGNIAAQTDGNKHATKYTHNPLEEVTEITDPLGHKTTKTYDAAGNVKTRKDATGRTTKYTYDEANRLTEIEYSDGKTPTVKYEYNKDNDQTVMTDGTGTTTSTYDQLDRPTETENGHKEKIKYEYNLGNEQTKITYPSGKAITRAYDKDGRLEKITDWNEHTTKFTYDTDSDLTVTTFPSETKDEDRYSYNNADMLSEVKMLKSTETLASLGYTRDNDGQLKTATSKGLPGSETTEDTYDPDSRLTKAGSTSYEYDPANNPTTIGTGTYKYNNADQLESGPSLTYTYNEVGQRTKTKPASGPATTYGYDQAGNLSTVERPKEGEVPKIEDTYTYTGEDLRASQTLSGTTSYLAWDTNEEVPVILSDGTNSYIYGPEELPVEQINNSTGTVLYIHHDQQGSTRLLTGSTGNPEATFTYDAYGNQTGHTGTAVSPLGYEAQYTSSDTGLIYLRARTYDPATAQFLSVDPLQAITRAPFSFAGDDPVNERDLTGLNEETVYCGPWGCFSGPGATGGGSGQVVGEIVEKNWHEFEGGAKAITEGVESIWTEGRGKGASKPNDNTGEPYNEEQDALIKIAKRAKKTGLTPEEAEILREWAEELNIEFRGPESHEKGKTRGQPHYHCGNQGHIPALP